MTNEVAILATYVNSALIFLASGSTAIFPSNITERELDKNTLEEVCTRGELPQGTNFNCYVLRDQTQKRGRVRSLSR